MQWKIDKFLFCENKQRLIYKNERIMLEPRQAEVLAYFCEHQQILVSRDDLIVNIWQGQAVTDNAINRIIAKLRKSLGDTAKNSEFIVTLPRKGYRFVAKAERIEEAQPEKADTGAANQVRLKGITRAAIFLLVLVVTLVYFAAYTPASRILPSVTSLTRDGGQEFLPAMAPNGRLLMYSALEQQQLNLYLKDIINSNKILVSDQLGNAGKGYWSKDSRRFLYLYTTEEKCEFRILSFDDSSDLLPTKKETVHTCPVGSYGALAFSHDEQNIIFSERASSVSPYYIYVKNLASGEVHKVNQPPTFLGGNSEFDLHPDENKLLIASPNAEQHLAFYLADLDTDKLSYLFKMNEYVCCPIWSHDGDKIVMAGPLPIYTIVEMDLDGTNLETIYTSSHHIHKLVRKPNSRDFIYSGGIYNRNIDFIAFADQQRSSVIDSAVDDSLPSLSNNQSKLAFLSNRSGSGQVWIKNINTGLEKRLTKFSDNQYYYDLKWSPKDTKIAALMINGVKIIDGVSGTSKKLKIRQQEIRGLSWFDENTLAYSAKQAATWRVFHYNLITEKVSALPELWAYVFYVGSDKAPVFIDKNNVIYFNGLPLNMKVANPVDHHRRFYFEATESTIFYIRDHRESSPQGSQASQKYSLIEYSLLDGKEMTLLKLDQYSHFSVSSKGIYVTDVKDRTADIFSVSF